MRVIIFTGSGGSGVSTVAAATATQLAHEGVRTLAFSLYRGLADVFEAPPVEGPQEVGADLQVMESRRYRDDADELRDWLEDVLDLRGMDPVLGEDLASLPGLNHVGRLLELEERVASGDYDAVVVDAPPVLQFLELPPALEAAARWQERLFAPREQTIFEPFLRAFAGDYASTADDVMERGQVLLERLTDLRGLLTDPQTCSVRFVTAAMHNAPDRLRETITALHLFSYASDAVVRTRARAASSERWCRPRHVLCPQWAKWRRGYRCCRARFGRRHRVGSMRCAALRPSCMAGCLPGTSFTSRRRGSWCMRTVSSRWSCCCRTRRRKISRWSSRKRVSSSTFGSTGVS
ncbi:MAG: ArsA family ATPase [Dehalococcoidia bacterium]